MKYLLPLVKKLSKNEELNLRTKDMNDEQILKELATEVPYSEIEDVFSKHYGFPYVKVDLKKIDRTLLRFFEVEYLKKESVMPYKFDEETNEWFFAISDITNNNVKKTLKDILLAKGQKVNFTFSFKHEIEKFYSMEEVEKIKPIDVGNEATEWVDAILQQGIAIRASDIHVEPKKEGLRVRYRVDGVMTGGQTFIMSEKEMSNIYVRLKVVGNMDISEKRKSQDGRIDNYEYKGNIYSMRISTINTIHGEKIVLRVFSESQEVVTLNELGFSEEQEDSIIRMISESNGIIYLAGATGSGKTTTLYAMLGELDENSLNIYTIENPVEKSIEGVNQVQVDENSKNTYASTLKTLLRQDPDIMVVGEIRDDETANLAVQASLTGHLVMTTLHANSALESLNRLSKMNVENYLIGASSVGFLSQRLVRVLCPYCKEKVEELPTYDLKWLESSLGEKVDYEQMKREGNYVCKNVGCDKCVDGYRGRIAVLEIIEVDEEIKELIASNESIKVIRNVLEKKGYKDMNYDGAMKALKGITTIKELMAKLEKQGGL